MDKILKYRNYLGTIEYSDADECWYGKVIGIRSLLSYEGSDVHELILDFFGVVDDYLKDCMETGMKPETTF